MSEDENGKEGGTKGGWRIEERLEGGRDEG